MNPYRQLLLLLFIGLFFAKTTEAQVIPQRFSYQGIARDATGASLPNTPIKVRVSILNGSVLGNGVYIEEHQAVTNPFGLFTLQVGGGQVQLGNFSNIKWAEDLKFMKVEIEIDNEGGYQTLGTNFLMSVPYALAAPKPTNMTLNDLLDVDFSNPNSGQSLVWNGTNWTAGSGSGSGGSSLVLSPRLSGLGTTGSPLDIARQGATFAQVLKWNGTAWEPADDEGEDLLPGPGINIINKEITHALHTGDVSGVVDLTVTGLRGNPIVAIPPTTGQVLKFIDGQGWLPSTDNSLVLFAGNGLEITGSTIKNIVWNVNGNNIYRSVGNVGIGTGSPTEQLQITKNFQLGGAFMPGGSAGIVGQILVSDGTNKQPLWKYPKDVVQTVGWSLTGNSGTNVGTNFLGTTDDTPLLVKTNSIERIRVEANGNVGIGETTPGAKLEVGGGDIYVNGSANGVVLKAPNGGCWRITVDNNGNLTTTNITCP
ncbi:MAG: hypothetical protein KDD67_16575 [Ignavibacteriae bacterium]|nr:hypothetical protein [Ignavibacteriota bacterium]MCB9217347.1 hypothetical protein [Ignavibacteria bacterium]